MKKVEKCVLKISDLVFDLNLYPRLKTGWLTAYQYAMAMKAGSRFPPVVVGRFKGKLYLLDGWHRVEALKLLGEEYVDADIRDYKSYRLMFADAVRLNATHGRPLSVQEKARIIDKLEELKFTPKEISEIIKVPVDKIARFKFKVVTAPNGRKIYLKSVVEKTVKDENAIAKINQDKFNVRNVQQLLEQLIVLLKAEPAIFEDEKVLELALQLYEVLAERLKLKVEAHAK